jgi:outer membrane protein assembly factor BamB
MEERFMEEARKPGRVRWLPLVLIVLAGGVLLGVLQTPDLFSTDAHRNLATIAATLLVGGLLLLWAIFGTGRARAFQIRSLLAAIAAVAAFFACVRVESVSGNLWPQLTWRWTAKPDELLVADLGAKRSDEPKVAADLTNLGEDDFPQFLGPNRNATIEAPPFDQDWDDRPPRLIWQKPIGAGWSSFAVVGDCAVTQEQRGDLEMVTCYNLSTGELLWSHGDNGRFSGVLSGDGPRCTPTVNEGRVYTLGAFGLLNCLDGRTGKRLWSHDIVKENGASVPEWGKSCSPLIADDLVIVSAGGPNGRSLVAYNKQSGEMAWHAGDGASSYSSPRLAELAGVRQVLIVNQQSVAAHAPDDGRVLWEFPWPGGNPKVADAVAVDGEHVFIAAGYGLGCQLLKIQKADDGQISPEVDWQSRALKPKFTNVIVRDGYVYGLDDGKAIVCLDLKDGKRRWHGGRYGHGQLLLVNDLLLVQAENGEVALVEASPERFHELARFAALEDQTWNNPVVAGRILLVRNAIQAACFQLPAEN